MLLTSSKCREVAGVAIGSMLTHSTHFIGSRKRPPRIPSQKVYVMICSKMCKRPTKRFLETLFPCQDLDAPQLRRQFYGKGRPPPLATSRSVFAERKRPAARRGFIHGIRSRNAAFDGLRRSRDESPESRARYQCLEFWLQTLDSRPSTLYGVGTGRQRSA